MIQSCAGPTCDRCGVKGANSVKIIGTDLDELEKLGQGVTEILKTVPGINQVIADEQGPPTYHAHASIMSLPRIFRTTLRPRLSIG